MSVVAGRVDTMNGGGSMSAVTIDEAWPDFGGPFTVAELDRMPSDGHRYELVDGVLVVSPRPTTVHQAVAGRLHGVLSAVCPEEYLVVPEPAVQLDPVTELSPTWWWSTWTTWAARSSRRRRCW